jgi:hypothetical protein
MRAARADVEVVDEELATGREPAAAPAPAGAAPPATVARSKLRKVWLPIPLLLLLLDVTFPLWFWRIPKLTSPSADYGYQFLLDVRQLATAAAPPGTVSVLALGSSVAGAFDPRQVEGLLRGGAGAAPVDVHRLLLPGIKPSDLRLFFATDGASLRPDVALVLLNPLDFLNPSFERDLKPQVRTVLPPWQTLRERSAFIPTISGKLDLALASVSNLYRYRKLIRSSIEDHGRLAWRWLRGSAPTRGYGWYADGYTRQDFGVPVAGDAVDLEYYVHPEWLRQRGQVTIQFATARGPLARKNETTPGWKRVRLALPPGHGPLLHVSTDSAWSPHAAGLEDDARLVGVQLRTAPGDPSNGDRPPLRYPPLERNRPDELLRMRGAEGRAFEERWEALLDADTEFGRRFRAYRNAKLAARDQPIDPSGEYAELERLVALLGARGTTVVLVNNPESSLMRTLYEDSPYYRSYLAFLHGLAARTPRARFHDLRAQLPAEDFNDWHHVTYIGQIKMGPVYADLIRGAFGGTGGEGGRDGKDRKDSRDDKDVD